MLNLGHTPRLGDRPDRGIYEIGRILMDEFNVTGGLTPTMIGLAIFGS